MRPRRVTLALGGGAARGLAHVGILRAAEEEGVDVAAVAGTSMGAVVGGLWATGLDAAEIEGLVLGLDWPRLGRVLLGSLLGTALHDLLRDLFGSTLIEDLDRPFAAVCADYDTGEEVAVTRGPLADAVRASSAIPGLLAPLRLGGRTLADGALVAPVPVRAARGLADDPVVACNVLRLASRLEPATELALRSTPRRGFNAAARKIEQWLSRQHEQAGDPNLPSRWEALERAFLIMQEQLAAAQCEGVPAVTPRVAGFGWFDFASAGTIIELGAAAWREAGPCTGPP